MESSRQTLYAVQWTKSNKAVPVGLYPYIYSSVKPQKCKPEKVDAQTKIKGASPSHNENWQLAHKLNHYTHMLIF